MLTAVDIDEITDLKFGTYINKYGAKSSILGVLLGSSPTDAFVSRCSMRTCL